MTDSETCGISIVVGTRLDREAFFKESLLGTTLIRSRKTTKYHLFLNNRLGLPKIYNLALSEEDSRRRTYVFVHDDVMITDLFWEERVFAALEKFDVVGVAGNKVRRPNQPSWIFKSIDLVSNTLVREDPANLSGRVGHGDRFPPKNVSRYGPVPSVVKLLDGVMLCVKGETLLKHALRFDEQFDFHFYDLDFCRQAEKLGLRCGTFDLSVIHKSGGNFGSEAWSAGYQKYLAKWTD